MAQVGRKVYVEWPELNENGIRFVSSRLDEDSDRENTVRLPKDKIAPEGSKSRQSNPPAKQITVRQPKKQVDQKGNAPKAANVSQQQSPPQNFNEDDPEDLRREAAYQNDLQQRLAQQQQSNGQKSPVPPLNFSEMDRSSMQEFIREEMDINLRSSDDDNANRKATTRVRQPAKQPQQTVTRAKQAAQPKALLQPLGVQPKGPKDQDPQPAEPEQYDQAEDGQEQSQEELPFDMSSPRGEMAWGGKPKQKKVELGRDFVSENKQLRREKQKKSYAKMLLEKAGPETVSSAPVGAQAEPDSGFPPPQYLMPASYGVSRSVAAPPPYSAMPPMASTLSAFYQQQAPSSQPQFGAMASNFAPMDAILPASYGSLPDLTAPDRQKSRSTLPPGDVYTVVTLQRHQSPLPPIDDHYSRVKQMAELGIPASVSPGYDYGYKDMYAKQRRGADYKRYTLSDYRSIQRIDKLDQRLGPDLDTAEYRERLEKRKRQQMYGRRVNTENKKIFAEEQHVLEKAKEQGAFFVTYDHPEEIRERKRLEVLDAGDPRYTEMTHRLVTHRTSRTDKSHRNDPLVKRLGSSPPPAFPRTRTSALPEEDVLNVRTVPPPLGSSAKFYTDMLIDTHRKAELGAEKAATVLPSNLNERQFLKALNNEAETFKQPVEETKPKLSKRELAKQYSEQVRNQYMHHARRHRAEPEQKPQQSNRPKFTYGTYSHELEQLDEELVKLHERHIEDKVRVDAIRQAY